MSMPFRKGTPVRVRIFAGNEFSVEIFGMLSDVLDVGEKLCVTVDFLNGAPSDRQLVSAEILEITDNNFVVTKDAKYHVEFWKETLV